MDTQRDDVWIDTQRDDVWKSYDCGRMINIATVPINAIQSFDILHGEYMRIHHARQLVTVE